MPQKNPTDLFKLITPAVDAIYSRQEAELLATFRKRILSFRVAAIVWKRVAKGLADWQRGLIFRVLRNDWQLLGDIPYIELNKAELKQLFASLESVEAVAAFKKTLTEKRRSRSDSAAMRFYKNNLLQHAKGLTWLQSRQSKGMKLVERTLSLYTRSMDLCFARVQEDRGYLAQCFLDGHAIETLADMIITDSDSHKGGKRVVFLDLLYKTGLKSAKRRVVYKPSDVEIDYRIAGKNTPAITQLFEDNHSRGIFPEPHESFFEMLDRLKFDTSNKELAKVWSADAKTQQQLEGLLSLPTFVVLPRNPGSRLKINASTQMLPIDTSYGYLEYLSFQPKAPELGMLMPDQARPRLEAYAGNKRKWQKDPFAASGASDWITENPAVALPVFRLWGRLMSIACVLLQTDLHHQNQRLHGLKPHIIDLENCLIKSCPVPGGPSGTLMPEALTKLSAAIGMGPMTEGTSNQLYFKTGSRRARWLSISEPAHALQIKHGLNEALTAMQAFREDIAHWAQAADLANVVVRHVAEATGNLTTAVSGYVAELFNPANANADSATILAEFMSDRRAAAVGVWKHSKSGYMRDDNPKYALEISAYNGRDFADRSVPVFYRRVGSLDLLTWWGEVVKYKIEEDDTRDMAFSTYHKNKGTDLLTTSLKTKLPEAEADLKSQIEAFILSALPIAPKHIFGDGK